MRTVNIPYQSFCWVIGTTSFRTAKLNLKIEEQLLLLNEFMQVIVLGIGTLHHKKNYDFMKEKASYLVLLKEKIKIRENIWSCRYWFNFQR